MTLSGKQNHYNVKFLTGYGFSIKVKNSKIILKNTADPFKEPEIEEYFVPGMHYKKIDNSSCQRSGCGYWVNDFS